MGLGAAAECTGGSGREVDKGSQHYLGQMVDGLPVGTGEDRLLVPG